MRKVSLILACCLSFLFFASCNEENIDDLLGKSPQVEFVKEADHPGDAYSLLVGESITFKVRIAPGEKSDAALEDYIFTIKDNSDAVVFEDRQSITEDRYSPHFFDETFLADKAGNYTVTAIVRDDTGAENIAAVYLDCATPIIEEIGSFKGTVALSGNLVIDNPLTGPTETALDPTDVELVVKMGNTNEDGVAEVQLTIDGSIVTLQCRKEEDRYVFDEFHFTKPIDLLSLATVDFDIEITNMVGVLDGDILNLTADAKGNGSCEVVLMLPVTVTADLDGGMEGSLDKVKE